jgi:hypothetical protein
MHFLIKEFKMTDKLKELLKEVGIDLTDIIKDYGAFFVVIAIIIYVFKKMKK